jgi:NtrC-family two-component system response regulator AlgB
MNTHPLKVLLVDDDKNIRNTLLISLRNLGCQAESAPSAEEALRLLKLQVFDFVLTDFKMEGKTGIDLIKSIKQLHPAPVVAIMTAFASYENAVNAIKEGAFDYLPKPFSTAQLSQLLSRVRMIVELKRENDFLKKGSYRSDYFSGMTSPAMARLEEFVNQVSETNATLLMIGESGTGKTELAKVIHERSSRSKRPFVVVNCTSLAETLLESELFGHVKGAFTGAVHEHLGKFELAHHGTVFLDEIGDLSLNGQAKLLRVLQEKVIERVGGNKSIPVDIRVIAATHKNLEKAVQEGRFREDLYYRLNVFECTVVSLRHRKEDLPVLIEKFLREFSIQAQEPVKKQIPEPILSLLFSYTWPGNIRELRNLIERIVYLSRGRAIVVEDLPSAVRLQNDAKQSTLLGRVKTLEEVEKDQIERVLSQVSNQEAAAELLGITTVTLWRKRKQYGLP